MSLGLDRLLLCNTVSAAYHTSPFPSLWGEITEEIDREAQAHMAIVFLAPTEKYVAALGPDSLSLTEPHHLTSKEKSE